jgi:hypothetical protein
MSNHANYLKKGDFNRICDRCSFKYKASKTMREWDNLIVCKKCFELRQPQDFIKAVPDPQIVPDPRPRPTPIFVPDP